MCEGGRGREGRPRGLEGEPWAPWMAASAAVTLPFSSRTGPGGCRGPRGGGPGSQGAARPVPAGVCSGPWRVGRGGSRTASPPCRPAPHVGRCLGCVTLDGALTSLRLSFPSARGAGIRVPGPRVVVGTRGDRARKGCVGPTVATGSWSLASAAWPSPFTQCPGDPLRLCRGWEVVVVVGEVGERGRPSVQPLGCSPWERRRAGVPCAHCTDAQTEADGLREPGAAVRGAGCAW